MAIESGIPYSLSIDDSAGSARDVAADVSNLTISTPRATQDITTLGQSAMDKLLLLADLTININGFFNDASNRLHDVLKTVPSTSVTRTISNGVSGQTLNAECLITDYQLTRGADGSITVTAPATLTGGNAPTWS